MRAELARMAADADMVTNEVGYRCQQYQTGCPVIVVYRLIVFLVPRKYKKNVDHGGRG